REFIRLVGHVREPRLVLGVLRDVAREHRLAAVVAVAGPVEHVESAGLGGEPHAGGAGERGATADEPCSAGRGRELEGLGPGEPALKRIALPVHPYRLLRSTG